MKLYRYSNFKENKDSKYIDIGKKYGIGNYTINDDGSVDVFDSVFICELGLSELPLTFGNVTGHFDCSNNELISLKGSPISVGRDFWCSGNRLTSLKGSPKFLDNSFFCGRNQLISLDGAPESIGGDFICFDNRLTSIEGSPRYVGGEFDCSDNQLTSLKGISKSFETLNCQGNKLRDVQGIREGWRGDFYIIGNPVYEIFKLFPKGRHDEVVEYLNEYDVIRDDGKVVVLQALEQVFVEMKLDIPEIENIKGYEII